MTPDAPVGGRRGIRRANLARPGREQPKSGRSALAGSEKEETWAHLRPSQPAIPGSCCCTSINPYMGIIHT